MSPFDSYDASRRYEWVSVKWMYLVTYANPLGVQPRHVQVGSNAIASALALPGVVAAYVLKQVRTNSRVASIVDNDFKRTGQLLIDGTFVTFPMDRPITVGYFPLNDLERAALVLPVVG